jgi:PTS system nitrogen regulatory IIA component
VKRNAQTPGALATSLMLNAIICRTDSTTPEAVIRELLDELTRSLKKEGIAIAPDDIHRRLMEATTVVTDGIALPHVRLPELHAARMALATSRAGIPFGEGDDRLARVVIVILAPKDAPGAYLQILSTIAAIGRTRQLADDLLAMPSPSEVLAYFHRGDNGPPPYVCAGDLMERYPPTLLDTDTLEDAIDRFTRENLINLPVVDRDGDLVGVVTAYALMRVCLPDYILWMDDVSPIINFEPFANVLKHESSTWLAEIMSDDYAVVAEDAPAIEVAKEITKHKTREAFVVRGKKLVGIISLQRFLTMVLRE